jgi:hypothetical protein
MYLMLNHGLILWENMAMEERPKKAIDKIFREGVLIDEALKQSVREALLCHKRAGNPIVAWRDGKMVWIPPEEINALEG